MRLLLLVYAVTAGITGGVTRAVRDGFVYDAADMLFKERGLPGVRIQTSQDGGQNCPRTTDSGIGQLHRTTYLCAL